MLYLEKPAEFLELCEQFEEKGGLSDLTSDENGRVSTVIAAASKDAAMIIESAILAVQEGLQAKQAKVKAKLRGDRLRATWEFDWVRVWVSRARRRSGEPDFYLSFYIGAVPGHLSILIWTKRFSGKRLAAYCASVFPANSGFRTDIAKRGADWANEENVGVFDLPITPAGAEPLLELIRGAVVPSVACITWNGLNDLPTEEASRAA